MSSRLIKDHNWTLWPQISRQMHTALNWGSSCSWDSHINLTEKKCWWFFLSKIQNPDTITQPSIDLKTWKTWKLNKDFKKFGPIRNNPSYKSQCVVFWHDLTQIKRKFLGKFQLKPASNFQWLWIIRWIIADGTNFF